MKKVLIIDDETMLLDLFAEVMKNEALVYTAQSPAEAIETFKSDTFDVVICDQNLKHKVKGDKILSSFQELSPATTFVLISGDLDTVCKTVEFQTLAKPFNLSDITKYVR